MATTTHTIQINENPRICNGTVSAKRVSKSRQYGACVVATATEKTVADIALGLADHEAKVAELTPALAAVLKANGFASVAAYEAHVAPLGSPWCRAVLDMEAAMRDAKQAANGGRWTQLTIAEYEEAKARVAATGLVNPYDGVLGAIGKLIQSLNNHTYAVTKIKSQNVQVGDQIVVTWCRDAGLAQKALRAHDGKLYSSRFYALSVRTDITVTSK